MLRRQLIVGLAMTAVMIVLTGITTWVIPVPLPATVETRAVPRTMPSTRPSTAPSTETTTASPRIMPRTCRRNIPMDRSSPISRVRSRTESARVFTTPIRAMMIDSASRP